MAVQKIITDLNLNGNRLLNVVLEQLTSEQQIGLTPGRIFIDQATGMIMVANSDGTGTSTGLRYNGKDAIKVDNAAAEVSLIISESDKILSQSAEGLVANLSIEFANEILTVKGKDGVVVGTATIPVGTGIESMEVVTDPEGQDPGVYLEVVYYTSTGPQTIYVSLAALQDAYYAGNGLQVSANTFSVKIDPESDTFVQVGPNGVKVSGIQAAIDEIYGVLGEMNTNTAKALDQKVSWDEEKKVISLPMDGSISALREANPEEGTQPEGGVLLAQRTYDEGVTLVTEVGTVKNKLTLNASERPQIDIQGGDSQKLAYLSDIPEAKYYSTEVEQGTSGSKTILATEHGCGTSPKVMTYLSEASQWVPVACQLAVSATGDITVSWNGQLDSTMKVVVTA